MAKAAPKKAVKPPTKSQILANIAETSGVSKKEVGAVLDALSGEIKKNLGAKGPGVFTLPGLVKIIKHRVPPKPARKGVEVRNIRTGEVTIKDMPAKPATNRVKVRALKNLKDMIL